MADTVTIDGREWSLEGLPRGMYAHLPIEVEVTMHRPRKLSSLTREEQRSYLLTGDFPASDTVMVQLERDGKPLTFGDQARGWIPGEREGWKAWPVRVDPPDGDELVVEAIEC